jgi:serine protease Do
MKGKGLLLVLLLSLFLATSSRAEEGGRIYPLPLVEAEEALVRWMITSGLKVSRISSGREEIRLRGVKEKEVWEIALLPHSPLATSIKVLREGGDLTEKNGSDEMWSLLDRYSEGQKWTKRGVSLEIPPAVLSCISSVVCLKAKLETGEIQFTGFRVDEKGLILSTAHDLKAIQNITVTLNSGEEVKGNLIKIDPHRDLILIDSPSKGVGFISLEKGRKLLKPGEMVYAIGCSSKTQGRIHSGVIGGAIRMTVGLPLWQVTMETLPGSSGSPVFDRQGNLAALVKGRFRGTETVGFLIPLETIIEFLNEK